MVYLVGLIVGGYVIKYKNGYEIYPGVYITGVLVISIIHLFFRKVKIILFNKINYITIVCQNVTPPMYDLS